MAIEISHGQMGKWYSIRQCIAWVDVNRPPEEWDAEDDGGPIPQASYEGKPGAFRDSWDKLLDLLTSGKVMLRGCPVSNSQSTIEGFQIGSPCRIQPFMIEEMGLSGFSETFSTFTYGRPIVSCKYLRVQVDFFELMSHVQPLIFAQRWGRCDVLTYTPPREDLERQDYSLSADQINDADKAKNEDFMDKTHPRYAPKLAGQNSTKKWPQGEFKL